MKKIKVWKWLAPVIFILPVSEITKGKVEAAQKNKGAWEGVYCIGGDAIESVDLNVKFGPKEDIAHLTVVTGTGDVTRTFTGHLKSGFFKKMLEKSRIEMVLNSDKHPETAFGGATSFAALLELTKNDKGDFEGYAALDGSVYKIYCPKDPAKYFDSGRSK